MDRKKMKEIVIIGAGDFGKEVAWLIEEINAKEPVYTILGYLDDDEEKIGQDLNGYKVLGKIDILMDLNREHLVYAVIAMQDGDIRKKIVNRFPEYHGWETLIHPSVHMSDRSTIGKGCIVCLNSSISVNTSVGNHCLLNVSTAIAHDCIVGDYTSMMSGACVCGHVQIEDGAYLSTNCTIVPGKKVGDHAKIGAGSVVICDVKSGVTVMGVPAKVIKM